MTKNKIEKVHTRRKIGLVAGTNKFRAFTQETVVCV